MLPKIKYMFGLLTKPIRNNFGLEGSAIVDASSGGRDGVDDGTNVDILFKINDKAGVDEEEEEEEDVVKFSKIFVLLITCCCQAKNQSRGMM